MDLDKNRFEQNVLEELDNKKQLKIANIVSCFKEDEIKDLAKFFSIIQGISVIIVPLIWYISDEEIVFDAVDEVYSKDGDWTHLKVFYK